MTTDRAPGPGGGEPPPGDGMDWETLGRYVAGEASQAELARIRSRLQEHPGEADRLDRLQELVRAGAAVPHAVDVEAALARVRQRMHEPDVRPITAAPSRRRSSWMIPAAVAAAAAVLVFGTQLMDTGGPGEPEFVPALETAAGARDSIVLGDGTLVVLGPASRLMVDRSYGMSRRALSLEGSGFFKVTHSQVPFTVRAGEVLVRDIGTAFTVRSHAEVEVVVTEGSVGVTVGDGAEAVLAVGDVARVTRDGAAVVERQGATEADVAWREGRLVFRDTPLLRVAEELARWYGGAVRLADPGLSQRRLTAELQGESREEALRIVELALGVRIETHGDTSVVHAVPRGGSALR